MRICDFCGTEISPKDMPRIDIHTEYACRAWQSSEFDICPNCKGELKNKVYQAEAEFVKSKKKGGEE